MWFFKNFLVVSIDFTCHAAKRNYTVRGSFTGSVAGFKESFRIHKSDINTDKVRCGVANHLLNVCKSAICKMEFEQVFPRKGENIDRILWEREKYW